MQIGSTTILSSSIVSGGASAKSSYIMYVNRMPECTVTAGGDVSRLHDWMTNIMYSAAAGTTKIDLTLPLEDAVNCVALAGVNWVAGGVTCSFYTYNGSAYVLKCELSGVRDGQPVMRVFDQVYTDRVRFVFTQTSTLYVGEAAFGEALQLPSLPSVGMQPAEWSDEDEVTTSTTQGMNIGASTVEAKGSTQTMEFKYITVDYMDNQWNAMRRTAKGRPIWVGWNQKDRLASVIFGHWSYQAPKFTSSVFSELQLTVRGMA